jgi:hypothetical protein
VKKVVLGNAEYILEKGSLMKKKDLCLPPRNMAMYLLKNRRSMTRVRILLGRDWILEDPHNDEDLKFVTEFLSYHKSEDCANLILDSFEGTTLKAYKAGWSLFVDFLLSCEWDDIVFFNSEEQVQELYDSFVSFLMNERNNVPYHATLQYESAVASFLNTAYNIHVADNVSQKLIVRGFKKRNLKAPAKRAI